MAYVVALKSGQLVSSKRNWISNRKIGERTKRFYSPDSNMAANFNATKKLFFDRNSTAVYDGVVEKKFGKYQHVFDIKIFLFIL